MPTYFCISVLCSSESHTTFFLQLTFGATVPRLSASVFVCWSVVIMGAFTIPMPRILQEYMMVAVAISPQPIAWIINIRPIRDYLRQHGPHNARGGKLLLLLALPWAWLWRRVTRRARTSPTNNDIVACTTNDKGQRSATLPEFHSSGYEHLHGSHLAAIMEFEPLKEAFGEYCRKALCSEVCCSALVGNRHARHPRA